MRCDIYSYGLVLIFMMTGEKPWSADESHAVLDARQQTPEVEVPEKLKGPLQQICEGCCASDPKMRPTAETVVTEHFQGVIFLLLCSSIMCSQCGRQFLFTFSKGLFYICST